MKRWHRSMKRKPKSYEDIIIIWKSGSITIDSIAIDDYGVGYFYGDVSADWEDVSKDIKQWAYVDKYFEKELNAGS